LRARRGRTSHFSSPGFQPWWLVSAKRHRLEACAWTFYIDALFCHPDRSRILSAEAERSTRVRRSPERSRRRFLFASFRQIASRSTSQRACQPVQIGFSQPRTSCSQSLRVDSSASLGMTRQAHAPQRIDPHRSKCRNSSHRLEGCASGIEHFVDDKTHFEKTRREAARLLILRALSAACAGTARPRAAVPSPLPSPVKSPSPRLSCARAGERQTERTRGGGER